MISLYVEKMNEMYWFFAGLKKKELFSFNQVKKAEADCYKNWNIVYGQKL